MSFLHLFLHIDSQLGAIISAYGPLTYGLLFLIIFCETGLVVTPFLPGDSLLFAAGAFAAKGYFHPLLLFVLLATAAIFGNLSNYFAGSLIGRKAFSLRIPYLNHDYLKRTEAFYEARGASAVILARFLPVFRTFIPFVAGIGHMHIQRFFLFTFAGSVLWTGLFLFLGFFFGKNPLVEQHFSLVILGIIVVTLLPGLCHWSLSHFRRQQST